MPEQMKLLNLKVESNGSSADYNKKIDIKHLKSEINDMSFGAL